MNITGYARECREGFDVRPFHDVDSLVLSQLCYYGFEHLPERRRRMPLSALLHGNLDELTRRYKNPAPHAAFLSAVADSPRFGNLILTYFRINQLPEEEKQFCAMTFRGKELAYVAFRGTDNSLTGWKEDMNMSFSDRVPAQGEAVRYLKMAAKSCSLPLYVGGHSKGGNLAVFASLFCGDPIQERICAVFNHDGPGFRPAVLAHPAYERMLDKLKKTMPAFSVFGMILSQREPVKVVRSDRSLLMQHDPLSWQILDGEFQTQPDFSAWSKKIGLVLNRWMSRYGDQERKRFVDTFFFLLTENGFTDTDLILEDWKKCTRTLYASGSRLDPETRKFMRDTVGSLIALSARAFLFPVSPKPAEVGREVEGGTPSQKQPDRKKGGKEAYKKASPQKTGDRGKASDEPPAPKKND